MAFKKLFTKEKPSGKTFEKPVEADVPLCECGKPVAIELGQSHVCKEHIRTK